MTTFLRLQWLRLRMRFLIVGYGVYSAVFWTVVLIGLSWLEGTGAGAFIPFLAIAWLLLTAPILYVQLALIIDLLGYVLIRRVSFFPLLIELADAAPAERVRKLKKLMPVGLEKHLSDEMPVPPEERAGWLARVSMVLADTSPLSCFATWAMVVLYRIPKTAYDTDSAPAPVIPLEVGRQRHAVEYGALSAAIRRVSAA